MNDTPRTDAERKRHKRSKTCPNDPVSADFARQLERERDTALSLFRSSERARSSLNEALDKVLADNTAMREAIREVFHSFADDPPSDASWLLDDRQNHALARLYPFTKP